MAQEHKSAGDVLSDVFSQAKDGLMSFGETIANKSKEAYESAKLNTQKVQLEGENEEYYKQLGKMIKEQEEYTDEMKASSKKIDENEAELQKLEAEMESEAPESKAEANMQEPKNDHDADSVPEVEAKSIDMKAEADEEAQEPLSDSSSSSSSSIEKEKYEHKQNSVTGTETEKLQVKHANEDDPKASYDEQPVPGSPDQKGEYK